MKGESEQTISFLFYLIRRKLSNIEVKFSEKASNQDRNRLKNEVVCLYYFNIYSILNINKNNRCV